jgi:hypothetical protein
MPWKVETTVAVRSRPTSTYLTSQVSPLMLRIGPTVVGFQSRHSVHPMVGEAAIIIHGTSRFVPSCLGCIKAPPEQPGKTTPEVKSCHPAYHLRNGMFGHDGAYGTDLSVNPQTGMVALVMVQCTSGDRWSARDPRRLRQSKSRPTWLSHRNHGTANAILQHLVNDSPTEGEINIFYRQAQPIAAIN